MSDEHKPEIFVQKQREQPKMWKYSHYSDPDDRLVACLVDSKTGDEVAVLYWIDTDGIMHLATNVGSEIVTNGYTLQNLRFDTYGCIETKMGN
jgi:hypothetical protein